MKGFDINQIKLKSEDKNIERTLTGEVTRGIQPGSPIVGNAELEKNEYIKYPDQSIQKVEGKTHEQGGVKMKLPDATEVISDTLKLKTKDVKSLEKDFGMDLSTKDTFARAIEKYTRKIGLTKINDEQEDIFKQLKKELAKTNIDDKTKKINNDYLSKKIYDLEAKKVPLEEKRKAFFDATFKMQEDNKPKTEDQNFKYGGVSSEAFAKLSKEMGLTVEEAQNLINGTSNTTFGLGGTYAELTKQIANKEATQKEVRKHIMQLRESGALSQAEWEKLDGQSDKVYVTIPESTKLRGTYEENAFSTINPNREAQTANEKTLGANKDPLTIIENLYKNFPDIVSDPTVFGGKIDIDELKKTGKAKWSGAEPSYTSQQKEVLNFQEKANDRMKASANHILSNKDKFDQATLDKATAYLKNETFSGPKIKTSSVEDKVRSYDQLLGDFTSGRYSLKMDVVTPEESKLLQAKGVHTLKQLSDEDIKTLSPDSQAKVAKLKEGLDPNADYSISTYTPIDPVTKAPIVPKESTDPTDNINTFVKSKYPQMFYTPDQSVMPPSAQTPETLIRNRFQRIDPIKIGTVNADQEVDKTAQFSISQLDGLTPSQRAATIASLLTTTGTLKNQSALSANITNAQNMANAEQFNIGQSDRENIAEGQNRLNFEARTLTGQAKTEQSLRNYLEYNHSVALNNFQNSQKLNMLNSLFPDYQLDFYGNSVNYDPSTEWKLQNNDIKNSFLQQPITTTDAQTLKKE